MEKELRADLEKLMTRSREAIVQIRRSRTSGCADLQPIADSGRFQERIVDRSTFDQMCRSQFLKSWQVRGDRPQLYKAKPRQPSVHSDGSSAKPE